MSDFDKLPKAGKGDHALAAVRAGLGSIPILGSVATELFNALVTPPLERRRDEWRESVGERLKVLEDAGFITITELSTNAAFVTTLMQASQAAVRNHQTEKLEALRNAVANSALPNPPSESIQQMFIQLIDSFTVWHLRILYLFQDPFPWFEKNGKQAPQFAISSDLQRVLLAAYPELTNQREFYDLVWSELNNKGLLSGSIHSMMSTHGAYERRTTELGNAFIKFVSDSGRAPVTQQPR